MRAAVRHNFAVGSLEVEAAAAAAVGEKVWLTTSRRSGPSCAMRWSKKSSIPSTVSSLATAVRRCPWQEA